MDKEKTIAIIIVVLCTILTSSGQLFLKLGSNNLSLDIFNLIQNYWLLAGIVLYGMGAILFIIALKFGELSVVYPIISLSFVWVTLLSSLFLNEELTSLKFSGIPLILIGVCLIGIGGGSG